MSPVTSLVTFIVPYIIDNLTSNISNFTSDIIRNIVRTCISSIVRHIISDVTLLVPSSRSSLGHAIGDMLSNLGDRTCRSRGFSDTVCMACEQSRVWCRGTAPLCNLDINSTIRSRSTQLLPGHKQTTAFLTQGARLCGFCLQFGLWHHTI